MDKLSYALGMSMAANFLNSGFKDIDVASFMKAFKEVMNNESTDLTPQDANRLIQKYFSKKTGRYVE